MEGRPGALRRRVAPRGALFGDRGVLQSYRAQHLAESRGREALIQRQEFDHGSLPTGSGSDDEDPFSRRCGRFGARRRASADQPFSPSQPRQDPRWSVSSQFGGLRILARPWPGASATRARGGRGLAPVLLRYLTAAGIGTTHLWPGRGEVEPSASAPA